MQNPNAGMEFVDEKYKFLKDENANLKMKLKESEDKVKLFEDALCAMGIEKKLLNNGLDQKNRYDKLLEIKKLFEQELKAKELLPYKTRIKTFQRIIEELLNENKELQNDRDYFEESYMELEKKYNNQDVTLQELKQDKEYFESQHTKLEQQLKDQRSQIQLLKQKNNELKDEASNYQSALGIVTNFNLNDDDQNHNVKLSEDILVLQDTLENYVTNLKPKIDVNVNETKKLLQQYGCKTKISDKEPNKPLIKAVLQRHVLEEIFVQADFYFKPSMLSKKEHHLELEIVSQTTGLTNLMEKFYHNRLGDDKVTRTPIKLRQQVYAALGIRGFNDIKKSESEHSIHNFIYTVSERINNMMNKYRIINDIEKKKYTKALAKDLVRDVVRIFYFRLKIQEPMAQYQWYNNNEKINKSHMKGSWDEDDVEDMVVEICSFPLILKPSHPDGFKVYTHAKVFPRHIIKTANSQDVKLKRL